MWTCACLCLECVCVGVCLFCVFRECIFVDVCLFVSRMCLCGRVLVCV